jgi:hypothetical protein
VLQYQFRQLISLIDPLVIAIAAYKDQSQRIRLRELRLKEDGFVVPTIGTVRPLAACQRRIITDSRWDCVQNIANFFFSLVPID